MIRVRTATLRLRRRALYRQGQRAHSASDARLRSAAPEQLERYNGLVGDFAERYAALRAHDDRAATTGLWRAYEAELERILLPKPPADFLGIGILLETMSLVVGGRLLRRELAYLASRRSAADLSALLRESPVGRPALLDDAHLSSHTAVHHLYHLERHRESTGWDWRDVTRAVEWGAGYGALARILACGAHGPTTQTLIDVPLLSALQWLYLSSVLGPSAVHVVDTPMQPPGPGVFIVPLGLAASALTIPALRTAVATGPERDPDRRSPVDLFISTWGLSESSAAVQRSVRDAEFFGARHVLLAYQRPRWQTSGSGDFGSLIAGIGATVQPLSILRHSDYAFR